ncbi:MAG: LytTR family DNA-binding domain-containing protein [Actinomycetota bacterium]
MALRVLAVDDEKLALDDLTWLLERHESVTSVVTARSGSEALQLLGSDEEIDGVFLDIQMPDLSGVDLARVLKNFRTPPPIAFVTAFDQYAVDAFDLNVCDYLLKPVAMERLDETIRRMIATEAEPSEQDDAGSLIRLVCRIGDRSIVVERDDVSRVEASGDYVRVFTADDSYLIRESISSLTSAWSSAGFIRIHRSHLIRSAHIEEVRSTDGRRSVVLQGEELPVSRRYARLLQDHLGGLR